jgi:hypothetical protein
MTNLAKKYLCLKPVCLFTVCAATTMIGIAAIAPPRTVPLNGTFGVTSVLNSTDIFGILEDSIHGVGIVPGLGFCTIAVLQHVNFLLDPPTITDSSWVLTFIGGDQLTVSFQGTGTGAPDPAFVELSGAGIITGGTGRFHEATGRVEAHGVVHSDTPPGVFPADGHATFTLDGVVRLSRP